MFSAYLWGIETGENERVDASGLCSQPTYEELKRLAENAVSKPVTRSQPTYEELKPLNCAGLIASVIGSQPTYEELKLL